MRTLLGKEIVDGLAPTGEAARRVQEILTTRFLHQRLLPDYSKREAGFVALRRDHDGQSSVHALSQLTNLTHTSRRRDHLGAHDGKPHCRVRVDRATRSARRHLAHAR